MEKRIQRKRTKGWKMPAGSVYVGRPTKWGNPFGVHKDEGGRSAATSLFTMWLVGDFPNTETIKREWIFDHLEELRGKDLVCWCPLDEPCHAVVLLKLANDEWI